MTQAEPAGLGPPISDGPGEDGNGKRNGGNGLIDVYVVSVPQCVNRGGGCEGVAEHNVAAAVPVDPFTNAPPRRFSSGFIVIDRARTALSTLAPDLAHEFFHVLQYAHNLNVYGAGPTKSWFLEASANWAEFNYFYTHNDAKDDLYRWYKIWFQNDDRSLLTVDPNVLGAHQYASWVWPLFMDQTKGAVGDLSGVRRRGGRVEPGRIRRNHRRVTSVCKELPRVRGAEPQRRRSRPSVPTLERDPVCRRLADKRSALHHEPRHHRRADAPPRH